MSTNYLPDDQFRKAMSVINWKGTVVSENNESIMFRPFNVEGSLEEFLDRFLPYPYVTDIPYFVASDPDSPEETRQGFVQYYVGSNPAFCGLCYFPKPNKVHTVLPKESFSRLPSFLWKSQSELQYDRFDKRDNVTAKNNHYIVYMTSKGELKETKYQINPLFGERIYHNVAKFIKTNDLRAWLSTKEGREFSEVELLSVLNEKNPAQYDAYMRKLSGSQVITAILAS
ncbi:hypothetical protein G6355_18190 [Vibrio cholerae]|uniref:hypothetical protein n=1 Tax=Vibrio cholerae TaxID=666 RepID=UPI002F3444C8